jgi:class 3 adenylate cyclase/predicted ATPase
MSAVRDWLEAIGLGQYADAFEANDIDTDLLPRIDDQLLKDIGVSSAGHRLRLRDAIARLASTSIADVSVASVTAAGTLLPGPPLPRLDRLDPGIAGEGRVGATAERRQLTVLFCDLVGSTALSARLDPEDLRAVIGAYHRVVAAVIERAGGFVAKYMGDGVLAYFGYPRADEHDAERAVRAGLALVDAVVGLDTAAGAPLSARVGIATGLVVVGDLIGEGASQEQAVVGETPNLAARLQALAAPGAVVIAPSTKRLTGGLFDYEDLDALEIKGLAAPVAASRVLRESGTESRFEALRAARTPLVGRDEELAMLERRWLQAKSGEGGVVLLSGEPGIGKSRLAQTLIDRLVGEAHTRLRFFCSPHHRDQALYPTITQLERAAGFRREDTAEQRLDKLEAVLAQATNDLGEAVPLLAALLSTPTGERWPPLNLSPQKQKEMTLRALVAQMEGLAARTPVLMLFEDAQWSDPTSLELHDLIIDRVPALRVLLIITFRPEFTPPWIGRPHVSALILNRLAPRQRAEMIAGVTGGKDLPPEIAAQIIDRTDGVPLFVEELTKAVLESGMLTDMGDRYAATGPVAPLAIPASLQASLLARLDRLAPVREVAQIGAALGRQFSHELIAAVAVPGSGPGMTPAQLDDALAQLVGAELIYRRGAPPDAEYTFKHALVQDAAYDSLLRSRRQQLHARIAGALEGRFPEIVAAQPALLAHHCTAAGLTEPAIAYWLAAGRQALARSATTEAAALLRRGLALVPALPETDRRPETELDLRIALGGALTASHTNWGVPELAEVYSRARELASALNRPRALLSALVSQLWDDWARADLQRVQRLATEIRELGDATGDVVAQVWGCDASGVGCFHLGEFITGRAYLEKGLALYDPAQRPAYAEVYPIDQLIMMRMHLTWLLASLGHLDQALVEHDAALGEARRLSHPLMRAIALTGTGLSGLRVCCGPGLLLQYADELLALATEHGLEHFRMHALIERGWCLAALGRADEGITLLTTGVTGWHDLGFVAFRPWALTLLADACRMAGQWQAALEHLAEARGLAEEKEVRWLQAETFRLTGDVLLAMGDAAAAEASYQDSIAIARQQSAKLWELRSAMSLARLWRDQGKRSEARELLAPVYGWFRRASARRSCKRRRRCWMSSAPIRVLEWPAALRLRPPAAGTSGTIQHEERGVVATMPSPGSANRTSPRRRLKGRFRDQGDRFFALPRRSAVGHEERFRPQRLRSRCGLRKRSAAVDD